MGKPQPWVIEARKMVAEQVAKVGPEGRINYAEIGKKVGKLPAHVQMRAGPKWEAYAMKDLGAALLRSIGFDRKPGVDEAEAFLKKFPNFIKEYEEHNMSDRQFTQVRIIHNGVSRPALRIDCSKKEAVDCLQHEEFSNKTGGATSPVHAAAVFRNHGWIVGGGPRADICPKCLKLMTDLRREKKREETDAKPVTVLDQGAKPVSVTTAIKPQIDVQKITAPQMPHTVTNTQVNPTTGFATTNPPVSNLTLKDVEKTAKRLIDEKLDSVYSSAKGGYLNGYSDQRIADELATQPEWVALVRDFGHGPATSAVDLSVDVRVLDEKAADVREAKRLVDAGIEAMTRLDKAINERLANFERASEEFKKTYSAIKAKLGSM